MQFRPESFDVFPLTSGEVFGFKKGCKLFEFVLFSYEPVLDYMLALKGRLVESKGLVLPEGLVLSKGLVLPEGGFC